MNFQIHSAQPKGPLSYFIKELYFLEITDCQTPILIMDDCCYDLVLFREQNARFTYGTQAIEQPISSSPFTIHDVAPPFRLLPQGMLSFFTIKVQPWTNATLFPSSTSSNGILHVPSWLGQSTATFHSSIFEDHTWEEKQAVALAFLSKLPMQDRTQLAEVKKVCELIDERNGVITVAALAETFNCSRQTLNKRFKKQVRYSLKRYLMNVRILRAVKYKIRNPETSFTELGLEFGYFDQAHFNRDFQQICGLNPVALFKELPPFFARHK